MKFLMMLAVLFFSFSSVAHEGHVEAPGSVKSIYGGVIKMGKLVHLEYVVNGKDLKIYVVPHEGDAMPSDLSLSAKASPKKGNSYELSLNKIEKGYQTTVDLKGANRLPIEVTLTTGGKTEKIKFQVER